MSKLSYFLGTVGVWIGLTGCGRELWPAALSTAPVAPLLHANEERLLLHAGARVGQPVQPDYDRERLLVGGHVGLAKNFAQNARFDVTAWGAYGTYTYSEVKYDSISGWRSEAGEANALTFHLQGNLMFAFRAGPSTRIEVGSGLGVGTEHSQEKVQRTNDFPSVTERQVATPTASLLVGVAHTFGEHTSLGVRWHLIGLGTGWTTSLRYKNIQLFLATQPLPTLVAAEEGAGYANWTAGLIAFFPLGD